MWKTNERSAMRTAIAGVLVTVAFAVLGFGALLTVGLGKEYGFGIELAPVIAFTVTMSALFAIWARTVYSPSRRPGSEIESHHHRPS
jgi:hypothetical protein